MDRRDFLLGMTAAGTVSGAAAASPADARTALESDMPVVRSMAELRATSPGSVPAEGATAAGRSTTIFLLGYNEALDGGEGVFVWEPLSNDPDDRGTVIAPMPRLRGRWVRSMASGPANVRWFGATGSGKSDDSAAIQAAMNTGLPIYFPAGDYGCRSTLTYGPAKPLIMIGAHSRPRASHALAARIIDARPSAGDEPLIRRVEGWMRAGGTFTDGKGGVPAFPHGDIVRLENMNIWGNENNAESQLMQLFSLRSCYFENCRFESFIMRGLLLGESIFDSSIINCSFLGRFFRKHDKTFRDPAVRAKALRSYGLHTQGHCYIVGATAVGCGVGIDMTGAGASLYGARIEMNAYGLVLGQGRYISSGGGKMMPYTLSRSVVSGVSFEGNAIGVLINDIAATAVIGVGGQGSPTAPGVRDFECEEGIRIQGGTQANLVSGLGVGGEYTRGAIVNFSRIAVQATAANNTQRDAAEFGAFSQFFGTTESGRVGAPYFHLLDVQAFPAALQQRHKSITAFHDLMLPGLTALNIRDVAEGGVAKGGPILAKNLGGAAAPARGATSVVVAFPGERSASAFAMVTGAQASGPVAGSPSLPPGDYWYATTVVAPHGETGINYDNDQGHTYWRYTVAPGQVVRLQFQGPMSGLKRRIYRGGRKGWFDGYWEQSDNAAFIDDGKRPFTGIGMPPNACNIPSLIEDDANYHVVATASWPTTVHVTAKATTGFTLNFATPAPDDRQTVAWLLFRA